MLSPPSRTPASASPTLDSSLQAFDPRPETFNDVPNVPYFVEFDLELVDLADDFSEAGDFSVGVGDGGGGTGGLMRGGALGLSRELLAGALAGSYIARHAQLRSREARRRDYTIDPVLDSPHQPLKVTAQHRQTPCI